MLLVVTTGHELLVHLTTPSRAVPTDVAEPEVGEPDVTSPT